MIRRQQDRSLIVEKSERQNPQSQDFFADERMLSESKSVTLKVDDVLDMLAGYQMDTHPIVDLSSTNDSGKCMLCGEKTNAPERKICWQCHKHHMKNIYKKAVGVFKNGEKEFDYKY